ncbi:MAG: hypothetical protein LBJ61_12045 [Deltaproteobacteria bacterium]|jgi:hypothetical protein|nr:hypothetical protein [Deltaproteobacteria bacterium]
MTTDSDNCLPPAPKGRLFVWPNVCPEGLRPPLPCHYLTWPSWECFRLNDLGLSPATESIIPIELEDPPAFSASLRSLLDSAGYAAVNYTLAGLSGTLPVSPLAGEESPRALARAIRGDPIDPYAHVPNRHNLGTNPAYLILTLWACSRHLSRQADEIVRNALNRRQALLDALSGQAGQAGALEREDNRPPEPTVLRALFSCWLTLAAPILGPDDGLWTPLEDSREEATRALAKHRSIKAKIWPDVNSLD